MGGFFKIFPFFFFSPMSQRNMDIVTQVVLSISKRHFDYVEMKWNT